MNHSVSRLSRLLPVAGAGLLLTGLVGCVSSENIPLTDDSAIRIMAQPAPRLAEKPALSEADRQAVEFAVFSQLLAHYFWDQKDYSAIFLQADEAQEKALIKQFPRHLPPVKPSYHSEVRPNQTPLDKDTGKPAMILSVEVSDPESNGRVQAIGRWYAGPAVTGFYTFTMAKSKDGWEVVSVQ
jgi:hypothetical protein